ncbi:MAG: nitrogen regulation protein NR(II) [Acidobacteriota bacterium]
MLDLMNGSPDADGERKRAVRRRARRSPAPATTRFRRGLLFFSIVFALLFLLDVAVVGNLIFRDLSRRVINQARFRTGLEAETIARLTPRLPLSGEVALPADLYRVVRTTTTFARYLDRVLRRYTIIQRIEIFDAKGKPVYDRARRTDRVGRRLARGAELPLPVLPGPGGREMPTRPRDPERELLERMGIPVPAPTLGPNGPADVDRLRQSKNIYDITVPLPGSEGSVKVSLSPEELQREINALRRDLILKILTGAGVSLILIVVAYIFVVKLFNKTRRLETETRMADRLAYVGTLAAGLAHEIRNPLSAMKLNLQMMEAGWQSGGVAEHEKEVLDLLRETRVEVDRLGSLVTSFLSYARPARLERKPVDLNRIVRDTLHFLRADAEKRKVRTEMSLSPGLPPVSLDEKQVRQAIMNIVRNAMAALESNGGGTVRVTTSRNGSGMLNLAIEDDGPGIPGERLARIFQVFYSSRPGGTGLGLPIAQRVVEGHGGRIEVESAEGSGTRFTLMFPLKPAGGAA